MGTSGSYGGPGSGASLIPSFLGGESPTAPSGAAGASASPPVQSPASPPIARRLSSARNNFSRFSRSGGDDRSSLGRAVSGYVSSGTGGGREAARHMGAARATGSALLGFLSDARTRGAREALRALNLEALAGKPLQEVFLGLVDYVCPNAVTIDDSIARTAFIETVADLVDLGIADLDGLTADQMQTVFELYATRAIEARICNDIGSNVLTMPADVRAAERVQTQLRDFVRRGVADALTAARAKFDALTPDRVLSFVSDIYEAAFNVMERMGRAEDQAR